MSFNARQALQRIRQSKANKPDFQKSLDSAPPLLFDDSKISDVRQVPRSYPQQLPNTTTIQTTSILSQLARKVQNLERVTRELTHDLSESNQTIDKLKRQKSHLQTHILKLEFENTQMKNSNKVFREIKQLQKKETPEKEVITRDHYQPMLVNSKSKTSSVTTIPEEVLSPVINEPVHRVLQRKEHNFRALKNSSKTGSIRAGSRHLEQLAQIMKQYPEMEKPVIMISISEAEFQ